ncbi:MAG: threonylcarbamoyl-AMP synthase [Spirochaetales bacterium]|nr:threonylcarbamoyl-AMP synthase [Spirochaetales bacterium]
MIEYVIETNIDDRILKKAAELLNNGGIVAYPTDTSWALGCSIHSKEGIQKLRKLKGDFKKHPLTLICSNITQISDVAFLSNSQFKIIKHYAPGPYVFILKALPKIEKKVNIKRMTLGIRIPQNPVPLKIIETLGCPIFSITASRNMAFQGWWDKHGAEGNLFEGGWELEYINGLGMILDTGDPLPKYLATVLDLTDEELVVVRQGIGDL